MLLSILLLFCIGCSKQWSDEKGHIYRHDIELSDFAFLFNEWDYELDMTDDEIALAQINSLRSDIKPDDIFDVLGLPIWTTEDFGTINYLYTIGAYYDRITIKFIPDKGVVDLDLGIYSIDNAEVKDIVKIWALGYSSSVNQGTYNTNRRYDIKNSELLFINKKTTSKDIQNELGAPHYYIEIREANIVDAEANIFVYELKNSDVFKVIYFRQGYILRAWIEDKEGNELDLLIDRSMESYYENRE